MALTTYTSYDDVRAALGVSAEEIEDATLSLPLYEYNLVVELEEIGDTIAADFAALPEVPNATELRFRQAMHLFATYAVAKQLLTSLPLFSPKEYSDGKASQSRYAQDPYKKTMERIEADYARFRIRLEEIFAVLKSSSAPTVTALVSIAVSTPSYDPVTG